jgi:hypothetical protein
LTEDESTSNSGSLTTLTCQYIAKGVRKYDWYCSTHSGKQKPCQSRSYALGSKWLRNFWQFHRWVRQADEFWRFVPPVIASMIDRIYSNELQNVKKFHTKSPTRTSPSTWFNVNADIGLWMWSSSPLKTKKLATATIHVHNTHSNLSVIARE